MINEIILENHESNKKNSIDEENINKDLEDENKSEPIESDFITQMMTNLL